MIPHILLVEDDTTTRQILGSVLESGGYQVTMAPNGAEALQLLQQQVFDVVVSDIRMREIDGVEVLNEARRLRFPPEVILLTGYGSLETAVAALRAGAFNYLLKPCISTELLECVQSAAQRRASNLRRAEAMRMIAQEFAEHLGGEGTSLPTIAATIPSVQQEDAPANRENRYVHVGGLKLDRFRHTASFNEQPLHATPIEFALLYCLAETPGRVQQCADIVRRTHGNNLPEAEAQMLLRPHVRNLRRKLPNDYLVTVRSTGYMLVDPTEI
jgi:DNA-binding response OmpR family regulator